MKDRLIQLLDLEHLTPSKFADLIGVQRSSVSHILSGRNKPSFDFLQKTLKTFPGLKAEWLIMGEGTVYEHMGRDGSDLFNQGPESPESNDIQAEGTHVNAELEPENPPEYPSDNEEDTGIVEQDFSDLVPETKNEAKKVVQVVLLHSDNTFTTYKPSQ